MVSLLLEVDIYITSEIITLDISVGLEFIGCILFINPILQREADIGIIFYDIRTACNTTDY